jgi:hypothetical protein
MVTGPAMNFFCGDCAPVVAVRATTTIKTTMLVLLSGRNLTLRIKFRAARVT